MHTGPFYFESQIQARQCALARGDYATAAALHAALGEHGITLAHTVDGTTWRDSGRQQTGRRVYVLMRASEGYEEYTEGPIAAYTREEDALARKAQIEAAIDAGPWEWVQDHGWCCGPAQVLDPLASQHTDYSVVWIELDPTWYGRRRPSRMVAALRTLAWWCTRHPARKGFVKRIDEAASDSCVQAVAS